MSFRTHCDWCAKWLNNGVDRAVMPVTFKRQVETRHAHWAEEVKATRHFCITPEPDDLDRWGRDRMGLVPDSDDADSCYDRAIQAITGTELREPGMGLEWRLVRVARATDSAETEPNTPLAPAASTVDDDLWRVMAALPASYKFVLPRAGITSMSQLEAMSDAELLALDRIGPAVLKVIRRLTTNPGETPEPAVAASRAWAYVAAAAERALDEPGLATEDHDNLLEIRDAAKKIATDGGQRVEEPGAAA